MRLIIGGDFNTQIDDECCELFLSNFLAEYDLVNTNEMDPRLKDLAYIFVQ